MSTNRLNIVTAEPENKKKVVSRSVRRHENQEKFERLWLVNPNQFNPSRSARERERIERTWRLILNKLDVSKARVADLPCGWGLLSSYLRKAGAEIHAIDIADRALMHVKELLRNACETVQACLPHTTLKDDYYDIVLSTDAISYLNSDDYRLYFAELSRIIKPQGHIICSTNIDIYSEDALLRFGELFETEFEIDHWLLSHHAYQIKLLNFLDAPAKFINAAQDSEIREQEITRRRSFNRFWFNINSTFIPSFFWRTINLCTGPLSKWIKQNRPILLFLERCCRFFSADSGISHVIILGRRRPLFAVQPQETPIERKHKREVWE